MIKKIFDLESPLMQFLSSLFDLAVLNLLMALCSLPIFTIGGAATAAYAVCFQMLQGKNAGTVRPFFRSFRLNIRQATGLWLMAVLAFSVFGIDICYFFLQSYVTGIGRAVLCGAVLLLLITASLVLTCAFALLALFENTLKETLRNAVLMVLQNLPRMLCILLADAAVWALTAFSPLIGPMLSAAMDFLCFSLTAYLNSKLLFPILKPFLTAPGSQ